MELRSAGADPRSPGEFAPGSNSTASEGSGKSGGVRVIYYFDEPAERIYMLFVYPKSKQATLTEDERAAVRRLVERLKS